MYHVELIKSPANEQLLDLKEKWHRYLDDYSENLYLLYQSYEWFEYINDHAKDDLYIYIIRNESKDIIGIIPLQVFTYRLVITVKKFNILNIPIRSAEILGGRLMVDSHDIAYRALVDILYDQGSNISAIYFKSLPEESFTAKEITNNWANSDNARLYFPYTDRFLHSVELPDTFDEYKKKFNSKKRNFYKRRIRQLNECFDGDLSFDCIQEEDHVEDFVDKVESMLKHTWKDKYYNVSDTIPDVEALKHLAKKNMLRAYILSSNNEAYAFVIGYVFRGVYHYSDLGYHEKVSKYSPGTVLLYLLIQDLIDKKDVVSVNFGIHDARYKREFGNKHIKDCSVLILKSTFANKVKMKLHSTLLFLINRIKKIAR